MNIEILEEKIGKHIKEKASFRDEITVTCDRESILPLCRILKEDEALSFDFLSDCCGLDMSPGAPRFMVVYHLYSLKYRHRLRIKVPLEEADPVIDSVIPVWQAANWLERECFDMFGIRFTDHPDLRRIILPAKFDGHPLRKDFPLEGM